MAGVGKPDGVAQFAENPGQGPVFPEAMGMNPVVQQVSVPFLDPGSSSQGFVLLQELDLEALMCEEGPGRKPGVTASDDDYVRHHDSASVVFQ